MTPATLLLITACAALGLAAITYTLGHHHGLSAAEAIVASLPHTDPSE